MCDAQRTLRNLFLGLPGTGIDELILRLDTNILPWREDNEVLQKKELAGWGGEGC